MCVHSVCIIDLGHTRDIQVCAYICVYTWDLYVYMLLDSWGIAPGYALSILGKQVLVWTLEMRPGRPTIQPGPRTARVRTANYHFLVSPLMDMAMISGQLFTMEHY